MKKRSSCELTIESQYNDRKPQPHQQRGGGEEQQQSVFQLTVWRYDAIIANNQQWESIWYNLPLARRENKALDPVVNMIGDDLSLFILTSRLSICCIKSGTISSLKSESNASAAGLKEFSKNEHILWPSILTLASLIRLSKWIFFVFAFSLVSSLTSTSP